MLPFCDDEKFATPGYNYTGLISASIYYRGTLTDFFKNQIYDRPVAYRSAQTSPLKFVYRKYSSVRKRMIDRLS